MRQVLGLEEDQVAEISGDHEKYEVRTPLERYAENERINNLKHVFSREIRHHRSLAFLNHFLVGYRSFV